MTTNILSSLPCSLPQTNIPSDIDAPGVASAYSHRLHALTPTDFTPDAIWRDSFALTGTLRTFYSASVPSAWRKRCRTRQAQVFSLKHELARVNRPIPGIGWIDVPFVFETVADLPLACAGFVSLVPGQNGSWKVWMLRTVLDQVLGWDVDQMPEEVEVPAEREGYVDCVVVGGGQAGLSTGGRLQALGVSYVIVDKNEEVGGCWLGRYDSTKLHLSRPFSQLPFDRTFPEDYPDKLSKYDLARGYKDWVDRYSINIWQSTTLTSGTWNENEKKWTLHLQQPNAHRTIQCAFVVMATGGGAQKPIMPHYPGEDIFEGAIMHSAEYKNSFPWKGKHGVIVGSANTAHDIVEDMLNAELKSVTMIQRSRTYVMPQEYFNDRLSMLYNDTVPTAMADRIFYSNPLVVSRLLAKANNNKQAASEPERFDSLERAGFKVDRFGDMISTLHERFGGHYVDIGTSAKIAGGLIKVKSDSLPVSYTKTGILFADGTEIPADLVVFATGFNGNLRDAVRDIFGDEVYNSVDDYWGLDEQGEVRGAYKPSGHPGLFYIGGTTGHARYYSRFVALQIKAAVLGIPLPVYNDTPGHQDGK